MSEQTAGAAMRPRAYVVIAVIVQLICTFFFVGQILSSLFGFAPISWNLYEFVEISAALGLLLGVFMGFSILRRTLVRNNEVEGQLRIAAGAFMEVVNENFTAWGLTPAERDVALFAIKGLSTQEMAALRNVSEGTIKAQSNAIYRKAGVNGRSQLLSLFIDALLDAAPR